MKKLRSFIFTAILGGVTVLLPLAIIFMVFHWLVLKAANIVGPMASFVSDQLGQGHWSYQLSIVIVVASLVGGCFFVGLLERTRLGAFALSQLDRLSKKVPGYVMIKETLSQFFSGKRSPFMGVALVRLWPDNIWCTALITDKHDNGLYTVFVPTGPNPTTGGIFHLEAQRVRPVDVPVESALRSIISCGQGSGEIVKKLNIS